MLDNIKQIIVVAPDQYAKHARLATHEISKLDNCKAAYWSVDQLRDNEFQIGPDHYILAIGNPSENIYTNDYSSFISLNYQKAGIYHGMDANKAIVFAKKDEIDKSTVSLIKSLKLVDKPGLEATVNPHALTGLWISGVAWPVLLYTWLLKFFIGKKKREKEKMEIATLAAVNLFMKIACENWVSSKQSA